VRVGREGRNADWKKEVTACRKMSEMLLTRSNKSLEMSE
jgi:hypothetical protein